MIINLWNNFREVNHGMNITNDERGSALQLAIISSIILSVGGQYILTKTNSATKFTRSYQISNIEQSLGLKLYNTSRSTEAIRTSWTQAGYSEDCLKNLDECSVTSGEFALLAYDKSPISGSYDRYGHRCDSDCVGDAIFEVSAVKFSIEQDIAGGGSDSTRKIMLSYETTRDGKKIMKNFLSSDPFEFTGLGSQKKCESLGADKYIVELSAGQAVCSPLVMNDGPRGDRGNQGPKGPKGRDGYDGAPGPRGYRGSLHLTRTSGCFSPNTKIKLANGEYREIDKLRNDDQLASPYLNTPMSIQRIDKGPEILPMYHLETSNFKIAVTQEHPMVTKDVFLGIEEIKMAKELKEGDLVLTKNGYEFLKVVKTEIMGENYMVYNVYIDAGPNVSEHLLESDGFITGDIYLQYMLVTQGVPNYMSANSNQNLSH